MKIVQSLWSKPAIDNRPQNEYKDNRYGWFSKKHYYISWALSALQLKRFYGELELVTDIVGNDLLINKLNLPYTSVKVVLDDLHEYPSDFFALGKMVAYSIQKEPFIHVDSDFFIWERFPANLENSQLLCQSKEEGIFHNKYYSDIYQNIIKRFKVHPEILKEFILKNRLIKSINAGIIGGNDVEFFRKYVKEAFLFIDGNKENFSAALPGELIGWNVIFEQFLFKAMFDKANIQANYLDARSDFSGWELTDFSGVPKRNKYIHLFSGFKKAEHFTDAMEYHLLTEHPSHYFHIMDLLKNNQI